MAFKCNCRVDKANTFFNEGIYGAKILTVDCILIPADVNPLGIESDVGSKNVAALDCTMATYEIPTETQK